MNDIEKAVLSALRKVKGDTDEIDVTVFIAGLLGANHIVKPLSDADKADLLARINP